MLSAGQDQYWRKTAVDLLAPEKGERFLDVATGTADIALEIAARHPFALKVMGVDFQGDVGGFPPEPGFPGGDQK